MFLKIREPSFNRLKKHTLRQNCQRFSAGNAVGFGYSDSGIGKKSKTHMRLGL